MLKSHDQFETFREQFWMVSVSRILVSVSFSMVVASVLKLLMLLTSMVLTDVQLLLSTSRTWYPTRGAILLNWVGTWYGIRRRSIVCYFLDVVRDLIWAPPRSSPLVGCTQILLLRFDCGRDGATVLMVGVFKSIQFKCSD